MKVLLINGSPNQLGCTYTALNEVATTLNAQDIETEIFWVGRKPISGCLACNGCAQAGHCILRDDVQVLQSRLDEFDGIIVGSPVYYAAASGQITSFLDRLFYGAQGHLAGKPGAAVVSCRRGGASAAFDQLNKYFTISNMPVVASQYWNQVHGMTPEDVHKDEEGMQTMRTLAVNMAWLLKSIEAGQRSGIPAPQYEPRVSTHFIR